MINAMNTNFQTMNRHQLMNYIYETGFYVTELTLFLDTHPSDSEALILLEKYSRLNNQAKRVYSVRFEPLPADSNADNNIFLWATKKWPWEGCS